jgi:hypothetical protein
MTQLIRPLHLVPDVERHGVTGYARELAAASGCAVSAEAPREPGAPLHVHFTDRLWGADPPAAAACIAALAERHPVSVTFHDLPQDSDGPRSEVRRAAAYREVMEAARAVACNSLWEAQLIAAFTPPQPAPKVIPLMVAPLKEPPVAPAPAPSDHPVVGLLGFVYPGKGHAEAIDAAGTCATRLGHGVDVVALGAVSDGHQGDAAALAERADRQGVSFSVTGYLSAAELTERARQVTVPLAAHRHVSASASIGSWLSAGRRPLVADSTYAREIAALRPGTIRRYDPAGLDTAIMAAIADPASGWLSAEVDLAPGPAQTAEAYLDWWTREVVW